jgi:hypothetical protein
MNLSCINLASQKCRLIIIKINNFSGNSLGNNIFLLIYAQENVSNSRIHTEVESVSFLSRAEIVYQGVAEVTSARDKKETPSYRGLYTILFGIITFLANKQLI